MKIRFLIIAILLPILASSQRTSKTNKYGLGIGVSYGFSIPSISEEEASWKEKFSPGTSLNLLFVSRINQKWIADAAIGISGYIINLKNETNIYTIDLVSPHITTGLSYNFQNAKVNEYFIKLKTGLQAAQKRTYVSEFDSYSVLLLKDKILYPFIRSEIGFRKYFKKRMAGSKDKMAAEFGVYYRYNFKIIATATIEEPDFEINIKPRGNLLGAYCRILFPMGRKRIRMKNLPMKELPIKKMPPRIYNPRYVH